MSDRPIIFLDMDGVIVDFVGGVCDLFEVNRDDLLKDWPKGSKGIHKALGIDLDLMWDQIDVCGQDFWENLRPYQHSFKFYKKLVVLGDVIICTSPARDPSCVAGKRAWMNNWFNWLLGSENFRDFVITPHKYLLAAPGRFLIDDYAPKVKKFRQYGGHGLLFGQPWNGMGEGGWEQCEKILEAIKRLSS